MTTLDSAQFSAALTALSDDSVRKDGEERWIRDRGFPVRDKDGKVRRIVGVADDVSETRKAQQELLRSNADLERFAYLASHDLQEPLRMVTSFVQLLQKRYEGELGSDADEYISHAVSGAERMRRLINGLLALSRVDSRDLKAERVSSNVLVRDAIADLKVAIEESGSKVKVGGNLPAVYGAKAQLTEVFQNLISNAIKSASPDRPPEIRVTARDRDGMVEFSVSDNGPGIEEKDFERIFEIFQRLEKAQDEKGTGIGLSLCRRIVERHGGKMWVKSEPGEGSSFVFTIPLQSTLPAENPA
ncbi:MAG: GHKL domain-containing protein [Verrucomicrobiales bacterium]|nr:GHKL domain-containing protein [Verrucomicrobiales bacterium]